MSKSKFDAILGRIREEDMITDQIIGGGSQSSGGGSTVAVGSPLTTKGDLYGFDTADARIPVGTDGQFLTADSTDAQGLSYKYQQYTYYIYNSTATPAGSTYASWSSLITEINNQGNPPTVILLTNPLGETLPAGNYNLDNITLWGNGVGVFAGGPFTYLADGFVATSWDNGGLDNSITMVSTSSTAVLTLSGSQTFTLERSSLIGSSNAPIFSQAAGGTVFIFRVNNGSAAYGSTLAFNPIFSLNDAGSTLLLIAGSSNSNLDNNIVTGTAGTLQRIISDASAAPDAYTNTDSGFSGTVSNDQLPNVANIKGPFYVKLRSYTSTTTPSIVLSTYDGMSMSALAGDMTLSISGTPYNGQLLTLRIKDDGTSRTLTWPATFADGTAVLPTATTISTWHEIVVRYNSTDNKYYCIYASTGSDLYMKGDIRVADEAYGAGWDGSTEVPTKNAIYDKIQTILDTTDAYTLSNVTTDRALDADSVTLAELADIVGTLVQDLKDRGIIG